MSPAKREPQLQYRYGIGEWYGELFVNLSSRQRQSFARLQKDNASKKQAIPCPPQQTENPEAKCSKAGGVCSICQYQLSKGRVTRAPDVLGALVTTCPNRFKEGNKVFRWVGETILGHSDYITATEIGFLEKPLSDHETGKRGRSDVGRVDMILASKATESHRFDWCALETQAVYFSGDSMNKEFDFLASRKELDIPFPTGRRRPDYRSSGPKRLMPQLLIKVPTLRRWGKKMAVVVDKPFFTALGKMDVTSDISSCDIAWFVVRYEPDINTRQATLKPDSVHFTTLERAVEGLTAGLPVSLKEFERRIREKLKLTTD